MTKHRIKGRTCSLVIDLPDYLDDKTKSVLVNIFNYCLDEESKEKVLGEVADLLKQTRKLINSLKKDGKYTNELERGIREFIGTQLNIGFEIGSSYTPGEDGKELTEILSDQYNYSRLISILPKTKRKEAEKVFFIMDLSVMAFEAGLMLSYHLSEELVEQHYNELKKATSYIQ